MSRRRHLKTILAAAIALVVVVQVVAAAPVCRCAGTEAPCQMPEPRRCCEDPAPATSCATGMSIGCCADVVAEPGDAFVLPADHGLQTPEPVPTESARDANPAPAGFTAPVTPPDLLSGAPVYLRHAALLI